MWGTMVQIFNHMKKEHPQSFDDDIVDSDESNHENIKTTNSNKIKSGKVTRIDIVNAISYFMRN